MEIGSSTVSHQLSILNIQTLHKKVFRGATTTSNSLKHSNLRQNRYAYLEELPRVVGDAVGDEHAQDPARARVADGLALDAHAEAELVAAAAAAPPSSAAAARAATRARASLAGVGDLIEEATGSPPISLTHAAPAEEDEAGRISERSPVEISFCSVNEVVDPIWTSQAAPRGPFDGDGTHRIGRTRRARRPSGHRDRVASGAGISHGPGLVRPTPLTAA